MRTKRLIRNRFSVRGDVTIIYVRKKGADVKVLVDTADFPRIAALPTTWGLTSNGYAYGRVRVQQGPRGIKRVSLSRLVLQAGEHLVVDHKNFNRLDNRRANLRAVSLGINNRHLQKPKSTNCQSGLRGVSRQHYSGRQKHITHFWRARVQVNGKALYLGIFKDKHQAAEAVQRKLREIQEASHA